MSDFLTCPKCGSTDIRKHGKYDKGSHKGEQKVKCKKCGYRSMVTNFGGVDLPIAPISLEQKEIERERHAKHRIGATASDATRKKMSIIHTGQPGFWTGKTIPQSICDKMSESHLGQEPWNKGIPSSKEMCDKQSKALKNKPKSEETRKNMSGENHHRWKGGITPLLKSIRALPEMTEWKMKVLKHDDYRDCFTGIRGNHNLEIHHIVPMSIIFERNNIKTLEDALNCKELWDINNGITMFKTAHTKHHKQHGVAILPRSYYFQKSN